MSSALNPLSAWIYGTNMNARKYFKIYIFLLSLYNINLTFQVEIFFYIPNCPPLGINFLHILKYRMLPFKAKFSEMPFPKLLHTFEDNISRVTMNVHFNSFTKNFYPNPINTKSYWFFLQIYTSLVIKIMQTSCLFDIYNRHYLAENSIKYIYRIAITKVLNKVVISWTLHRRTQSSGKKLLHFHRKWYRNEIIASSISIRSEYTFRELVSTFFNI